MKENARLRIHGEAILDEQGIDVKLTVYVGGYQSYSTFKDSNHAVIVIGIESLKADNPDKATLDLRVMGHFYHELAHVIYTQFEPMGHYRGLEAATQQAIPAFAAEKKSELLSGDEDAIKELGQLFYGHIRSKNSGDLLNMLEDAAIEVRIPGVGTSERRQHKILAAISAARNYAWSMEAPAVENGDKIVAKEPNKLFRLLLSEIHEMGVIGYRKEIRTPLVELHPEKKKIEDYVKWSKFSSQNTSERQDIVECLMDILSPLMEEKATSFTEAYLEALAMDKDMLQQMAEMSGSMSGASELGLSVPNMTAKGSCTNCKSEYEFDLPDEEEKKRQEKRSESEQSENGSGSDGSSSESGEEGSDDSSGENSSGQEGSQESSENGSENSSGNSESDSSENVSDDASGSDGGDGSQDDSGTGSSNSEEESQESSGNSTEDGTDGSEGESKDAEGENSADSQKASQNASKQGVDKAGASKPLPTKEGFERESADAIQREVDEVMGLEKTKAEKNEKKSLSSKSKEYVPTNLDGNRFHDGVDIVFEDHRDPRDWQPWKPDDARKLAQKTATHINKVVMYASQDQRAKGLTSGKLSRKSLYRAVTDGRVFERKTPGKKNQLRISLLIDQSGSMCGDKIENAKRTAWIFASACLRAHIPVSVWGHHTGGHSCYIHRFFKWGDGRKQLSAIGEVEDWGSNQDGLAIYQVAKDLVANRKPNEKLVLIVLSDGMPAGLNGYSGRAAEKDVREICAMFKKHFDVETIGMGIEMRGREQEGILEIYGENAILVNRSSELPLETVELLKKLFK